MKVFLFCSGEVRPYVKEAARQPLRWGSEAPEVPRVCGVWKRGLCHSFLTQGRWSLWQRWGRWRRGFEQVLQQRRLQLHPQWPGWHRRASWPVWPAVNTRGGQRILQPGAARRRRSQCWEHLQLIVFFFHFLVFVQSEFPTADHTGWRGQ